jgi:hypothetical protein
VGEPADAAGQRRRARADTLAASRADAPGEDRSALPLPEALVRLYLYLIGAQPKSESGARIDAQAWLAGQAASSSLVVPRAVARP